MISVTECLGVYMDFSKIPDGVLAKAQIRGTVVHKYCSAYAKNIWFPGEIPEDLKGYYDSFLNWFDSMVVEVIFAEERMYHSVYQYTGMPDLGVVLTTGERVIVDLKTPVGESKTWKGQLSAYIELARNNNLIFEKGGSLRLKEDGGTAKMVWYDPSAMDLNAFLSALNAYRYFK